MNDTKFNEAQIAEQLRQRLAGSLPDSYVASTGKSLLYKLEVDPSGKLLPSDISKPTRGQYAFQTDLLIEQKSPAIPLVVIELKADRFTTHDIITYSAKATHHKDIYPYLRYGFVVAGVGALSRKFMTHNQGIDFAMALPSVGTGDDEFIRLIRRQIGIAEKLAKLQLSREPFARYEKIIDIV